MMYEHDENSVIYNNANTLKEATLYWFTKNDLSFCVYSVCVGITILVHYVCETVISVYTVNVSDFESITSK